MQVKGVQLPGGPPAVARPDDLSQMSDTLAPFMARYAPGADLAGLDTLINERFYITRAVRDPTTWTIPRYGGPNHLGLWYNALP